jgi:hypothetical protein
VVAAARVARADAGRGAGTQPRLLTQAPGAALRRGRGRVAEAGGQADPLRGGAAAPSRGFAACARGGALRLLRPGAHEPGVPAARGRATRTTAAT